MQNRLIFGLDVNTKIEALELVKLLKEKVRWYKIGLELFCSEGPDVVREVLQEGVQVFLDLKFHDIPNTVTEVARVATKLGVHMFNVHTLGGSAMLKAAAEAAHQIYAELNLASKPDILGVTMLTSMQQSDLTELNISKTVAEEVHDLALLAQKHWLNGVVASPLEITTIRQACGYNFLIVTPGIRPVGSKPDDQKRKMTPAEAIAAGANMIVVSRPIREAKDPLEAASAILVDMEKGVQNRKIQMDEECTLPKNFLDSYYQHHQVKCRGTHHAGFQKRVK